MNKLIIFLAMSLSSLFAVASDYPYLIVRQANGAETTLEVGEGIEFSVTDGTLSAADRNGTFTFLIADLTDMYFSSDRSGLTAVFSDGHPVDVYAIDGTHIGRFVSVADACASLTGGGVYVFKNNCNSIKIKLTK